MPDRERPEPAYRDDAPRTNGAVAPSPTIAIYPFGISRLRLEQAIKATQVPAEIADDVRIADAVITMRSYYRRKPPALRDAEERNLPIYVIKSNTAYQIEQVLLQFRGGERSVRRDPMVEVFRVTEDAIAKVIDEGRPIELEPANSYVRRVQHELAGRYNLESKSSGKEPLRRVRILPSSPSGPPRR
jgi:hypothetical protein